MINPPIIIIGTGIAGYSLAREFRKLDSETPLLMITADAGDNYPKPMLSNALSKEKTADDVVISDANKMAVTLNAEIITHTMVEQIDLKGKIVKIRNKDGLQSKPYEKLILATGAKTNALSVKGNGCADVLSINNLNDYRQFRQRLATAKHIAIIGAGLIGCEFANDLSYTDTNITVIGNNSTAMYPLLPEQIGSALQAALTQYGVDWQLDVTANRIDKTDDNQYAITLNNGEIITADLVLSAIGLHPDLTLAKQANLITQRGIVTDLTLQTSDPHVYALGDCAEVAGLNLLYIAPIMAGAKALATTLTGTLTEVSYPAMPVMVKTTHYPIIVSPPARDAEGGWQFTYFDEGIKGEFTNENGALIGFVLSGAATNERQALIKLLPPILP